MIRNLRIFQSSALVLALFCPSLLFAQAEKDTVMGKEVAAREVLVQFRKGLTEADLREILQENDVAASNGVGGTGVTRLRSNRKSTRELLSDLQRDPRVQFAEPNYILKEPTVNTATIPNELVFGSLWALRNTGQTVRGVSGVPGADIEAANAWDLSTGSTSTVVAVIDTEIATIQPDVAQNF